MPCLNCAWKLYFAILQPSETILDHHETNKAIWSSKRTPRHLGTLRFRPQGEGVGGGVNPSPKGKRALLEDKQIR